MEVKSSKWGNSLAVRTPSRLPRSADSKEGADLEIGESDGCIVLRPVRRVRYELDALVSQKTDESINAEVESGGPVGREEW